MPLWSRDGDVASPTGAVRLALAALVLPHELAHYLALRPWCPALRIELSPAPGESAGIALARLSGPIPATTPTAAIRLCAAAPTLGFLALALAVEALVAPAGLTPVAVVATALVAYWAAPSGGDVNVFLRAGAVRRAGSFDARARPARAAGPVATALTVGVTVAVALLFLR